MKIHRHTGVGRYPVIYTWIPDQVRNDVQHFHVSLCPIWAWGFVPFKGQFHWQTADLRQKWKSGFSLGVIVPISLPFRKKRDFLLRPTPAVLI